MKEDSKKVRTRYKIAYNVDTETGELQTKFTPVLKRSTYRDSQILLNTLLTGTEASFNQLLAPLPMLRPVTNEEREYNVYVFKDEEADTKLFKERKQIYDALKLTFDNIIEGLFPDVQYVEDCRTVQQERVFDMSEAEAEEYRQSIQEVADKIRSMADEEEAAEVPAEEVKEKIINKEVS